MPRSARPTDPHTGFVITSAGFAAVIAKLELTGVTGLTHARLDAAARAVVAALATATGATSTLPLLSGLALVSSLRPTDAARFVFALHDVDDSGGEVTEEAVACMLRSAAYGCAGLAAALDAPDEEDLALLARAAMKRGASLCVSPSPPLALASPAPPGRIVEGGTSDGARVLGVEAFVRWVAEAPEAATWVESFRAPRARRGKPPQEPSAAANAAPLRALVARVRVVAVAVPCPNPHPPLRSGRPAAPHRPALCRHGPRRGRRCCRGVRAARPPHRPAAGPRAVAGRVALRHAHVRQAGPRFRRCGRALDRP